MRKVGGLLLAAFLASTVLGQDSARQNEKTFPTNEEIGHIVAETDRAMVQYELSIQQEQLVLGSRGAEGISTDQQVLSVWKMASKALRSKPQAFNGEAGFDFIVNLDDAARNSALCASTAVALVPGSMDSKDAKTAEALMGLAQSCSAVSTLVYQVSEDSSDLYRKYLAAESRLATREMSTLEGCMASLKGNTATRKPQ